MGNVDDIEKAWPTIQKHRWLFLKISLIAAGVAVGVVMWFSGQLIAIKDATIEHLKETTPKVVTSPQQQPTSPQLTSAAPAETAQVVSTPTPTPPVHHTVKAKQKLASTAPASSQPSPPAAQDPSLAQQKVEPRGVLIMRRGVMPDGSTRTLEDIYAACPPGVAVCLDEGGGPPVVGTIGTIEADGFDRNCLKAAPNSEQIGSIKCHAKPQDESSQQKPSVTLNGSP
jgi:hypothetical protein